MSGTIISHIIHSGIQTLRLEISNTEEILRSKRKRLYEMESLLTAISGCEVTKSVLPVSAEAEVQTQTESLEPAVQIRLDDETSSVGSTFISKLENKEVLKIFYRNKVVGVGIFCLDSSQKKGYYILDTRSKKKYPIMRNWSLTCKRELNPALKMDNPEKTVNCYRAGKWIKLEDMLKA
jgi:hypothetical protein